MYNNCISPGIVFVSLYKFKHSSKCTLLIRKVFKTYKTERKAQPRNSSYSRFTSQHRLVPTAQFYCTRSLTGSQINRIKTKQKELFR